MSCRLRPALFPCCPPYLHFPYPGEEDQGGGATEAANSANSIKNTSSVKNSTKSAKSAKNAKNARKSVKSTAAEAEDAEPRLEVIVAPHTSQSVLDCWRRLGASILQVQLTMSRVTMS